jgi:hypothetical protein
MIRGRSRWGRPRRDLHRMNLGEGEEGEVEGWSGRFRLGLLGGSGRCLDCVEEGRYKTIWARRSSYPKMRAKTKVVVLVRSQAQHPSLSTAGWQESTNSSVSGSFDWDPDYVQGGKSYRFPWTTTRRCWTCRRGCESRSGRWEADLGHVRASDFGGRRRKRKRRKCLLRASGRGWGYHLKERVDGYADAEVCYSTGYFENRN